MAQQEANITVQTLMQGRMIVLRLLCAFILITSLSDPSSAKGGNYHTEDLYNPQHIDSLPPEIRSAIMRKCSTPKALHPFASYSENFKQIVLHFEYFLCDDDGTYCTPSGCLHQVYVSEGGRYRLTRSYYAPPGQ